MMGRHRMACTEDAAVHGRARRFATYVRAHACASRSRQKRNEHFTQADKAVQSKNKQGMQ